MLHDETRKLLIEAWNKTHNAKEIAITKAISLFFLPKPVQRVKKIKKIYKLCNCTTSQQEKVVVDQNKNIL